jgi:hypothetical protein
MAEKRRPTFVFLLKNYGNDGKASKTNKVECFPERVFRKDSKGDNLYRLRVNGKWWPKEYKGSRFFYKTQIMQMISKSINLGK